MAYTVEKEGFIVPARDTQCFPAVMHSLPDLDLAMSYCRQRRVAIQAGGNIGVWAKRMAKHFDFVMTFEPATENFRCLVQNVPDNVACFPMALGNEVGGWTKMKYEPGNIGSTMTNNEAPGVPVPIGVIDYFEFNSVDLIYLDIEGDEIEALKGAMGTIERHRPVIGVEDKGVKVPHKAVVEYLQRVHNYVVVEEPNRDFILVPAEFGE